MKLLPVLIALLLPATALAQSASPKPPMVGDRPLVQVKPRPAKPAKPVKPAVSKKAAKVTNTKAARAKAQAVKAKTVKAKAKPVAKPKPAPKKAAPVLDLDKLSMGH